MSEFQFGMCNESAISGKIDNLKEYKYQCGKSCVKAGELGGV